MSETGAGRVGLATRARRRHRPDPRHQARLSRVEENTATDGIDLSPDQIEQLNNLAPATGERHEEGNMAVIDR